MNSLDLQERCADFVRAMRCRASQARKVAGLPNTRPHHAEELQIEADAMDWAARAAQDYLLHGTPVAMDAPKSTIAAAIQREITDELLVQAEAWPPNASAYARSTEIVNATFDRWSR
jgi:hypothetical protein